VKTTYYGYIQDIWELDYGVRLQISVFKCQWVKHLNGVSVDNYRLTLVDLKNVGHKDDPLVLADRVAQVFYVLDPETGKHVVVSTKQKIVGVKNMEDNNEDVKQFKEMPLFTNPMNMKHIEKDFDKNLMPYMQKGGNGKFI
jgi:glucose dehydrogenase